MVLEAQELNSNSICILEDLLSDETLEGLKNLAKIQTDTTKTLDAQNEGDNSSVKAEVSQG